ncbi:MAG: NAD-dependent epimerase/dehydratase family protein [bacterium]
MRVLVTGANGFVGASVCRAVALAGHEVRAMVRPGAHDEDLPPDVERVQGDVTVAASLGPCVEGVDAIVHTAGVKHATRPSTFQRVNVDGTAHLAEASLAAGVGRFVLVSTIAAQGPSPLGGAHVSAGSEAPINDYGRSKLAAEQRLLALRPEGTTILRPSLLYGPVDDHLLVWARMVRRRVVPVVPELPLSFLHVDDLAALVVRVLAHPDPAPGPFFVSDGEPTTMGAVIDHLERVLDSGPTLRVPLPAGRLAVLAPVVEGFARASGLGALAGRRLGEMAASGWVCLSGAAHEAFGFHPTHRLVEDLPGAIGGYRSAGLLPPT